MSENIQIRNFVSSSDLLPLSLIEASDNVQTAARNLLLELKYKDAFIFSIYIDDVLSGYLIYRIKIHEFIILKLKSIDDREDLKSMLLISLINKMQNNHRIHNIFFDVDEYDLSTQLLLKNSDFRATAIHTDSDNMHFIHFEKSI